MMSAIILVTDRQGLNLAEHAAAAAAITQIRIEHIIIFCSDFTPNKDNALIRNAANLGKSVQYRWLDIDPKLAADHKAQGAHTHVSSTALMKLGAISSLAGEFERCLYIDNDVLLIRDFALNFLNFEGRPIAAAYDIAKVGEMDKSRSFYDRCASHGRSAHYFNSGVLAIDLIKWNSSFDGVYAAEVTRHKEHCDFQDDCSCDDQCAWNGTFENNWTRLPLAFNFQACAMFHPDWDTAIARHYVGPQKFLPVKAWRNDRRDTLLINKARLILGQGPVPKIRMGVLRFLNKLRNHRSKKPVAQALALVSRMGTLPH